MVEHAPISNGHGGLIQIALPDNLIRIDQFFAQETGLEFNLRTDPERFGSFPFNGFATYSETIFRGASINISVPE